jgi:hypothetical protein
MGLVVGALRCAALAVPSACTSSVAVLQLDGQRSCLSLDPASNRLSCVCRGSTPVELRSRVHSVVTGLARDKFPNLLAEDAVSVACGVCRCLNVLTPYAQLKAAQGKAVRCQYCSSRPALEVLDVVESPETTLAKLVGRLEAGDADIKPEHISPLAARVCDKVLGLAHRSYPRLWLPWGGRSGGWMWVCEEPRGWHVGGKVGTSHAETPVPKALVPALHLLARAVRAMCKISGTMRGTMDACCASLAGSGHSGEVLGDAIAAVAPSAPPSGASDTGGAMRERKRRRVSLTDDDAEDAKDVESSAPSGVHLQHTPSDVDWYMEWTSALARALGGGKHVWCADPTLLDRHGHWACGAHAVERAPAVASASLRRARSGLWSRQTLFLLCSPPHRFSAVCLAFSLAYSDLPGRCLRAMPPLSEVNWSATCVLR